MQRILATLVAAVIALGLAGCGGGAQPGYSPDADQDVTQETTEAAAQPTSKAPDPKPDPNCGKVSDAMAAAIATGAEDGVGRIRPVAAASYRSPDFKKAFFIAVKFNAPGITETGVWVSNSLEPGGGVIMAADSIAQEFTVWPDASTSDAAIEVTDPAIDEAIACLKATG